MDYDEFKLLNFSSKGYDNIKQLKDDILKSFSRLDNKNILDKLNILKKKILESVYKVKSNKKLELLQYQQDIINDLITDQNLVDKFIISDDTISEPYFPPIGSPNFNNTIKNLKIFNQYKNQDISGKLSNLVEGKTDTPKMASISNDFERSNSQSFVSKYLSPNTPYTGLLLYHGVGVGKTCAALSIAEANNDVYKKRKIIVTPSTKLQKSWKDQIFNLEKEINKEKYNNFIRSTNEVKISFKDWLFYSEKYENYQKLLKKQITKESDHHLKEKLKNKSKISFSDFLEKNIEDVQYGNYLPINKIQCLDEVLVDEININSSYKLSKLINKKIDEKYRFLTYTTIANNYIKWQEDKKKTYLLNLNENLRDNIVGKHNLPDKINIERGELSVKKIKEINHLLLGQNNKLLTLLGRDPINNNDIINKINLKGSSIKNYIMDEYANRLIIFDEIHKVRNSDDSKEVESKNIKDLKMEIIHMIARYCDNTKFVLLSATPMQSESSEIIDVLNILLLNDGRLPLLKDEVFDKNNLIRESMRSFFIKSTTGYVSFLKGENPLEFPIKLDPSSENLVDDKMLPQLKSLPYLPKPLSTYYHKKTEGQYLDADDWIKQLTLFKNEMIDYQQLIWLGLSRLGENYKKTSIDSFILENDGETLIRKLVIKHTDGEIDTDIIFDFLREKGIEGDFTIDRKTKSKGGITITYYTDDNVDIVNDKIFNINNYEFTNDFVNRYSELSWVKPNMIIQFNSVNDKFWNFKGYLGSKSIFHACIMTFPIDKESVDYIIEIGDKLANDQNVSLQELNKTSDLLHRTIGEDGLKESFNIVKDKASNKNFYEIKSYCQSFLDLTSERGIKNYSAKFYNILRLLGNTSGVVFVYSNFLQDSIKVLAMALEKNGYRQFKKEETWNKEIEDWDNKDENNSLLIRSQLPDGENRRNYEGILFSEITDPQKKIQGRFVLCKSPLNYDDIKEANGDYLNSNLYGEHIKIILGTPVLQVGYSLLRIRQLHIIDPWYHLNVTNQIIGRGMRNHSHKLLPFNQRNIMVFLHAASLPYLTQKNFNSQFDKIKDLVSRSHLQNRIIEDSSILETTDEYLYRLSVNKTIKMAKIERLLQENSIDCALNYHLNVLSKNKLKDVTKFDLVTFQNHIVKDFAIGYNDNSWFCSFTSCNYKCLESTVKKPGEDRPERDAHPIEEIEVDKIKDIEALFRDNFSISIEDINKLSSLDEKVIEKTINYMIDNGITIKDTYQRDSILYEIDGVYYLHPVSHGLELDYDKLLENTKRKIKDFYLYNFSGTLDQLYKWVNSEEGVFYKALNKLVRSREKVYDCYMRKGYIIYRYDKSSRNSIYLFQPEFNSNNEIYRNQKTNENIGQTYRYTLPKKITYLNENPIYNNSLPIDYDYLDKDTKTKQRIITTQKSAKLEISSLTKKYAPLINILLVNIKRSLGSFYPHIVKNKFGCLRISNKKVIQVKKNTPRNSEYYNSVPIPTLNDLYLCGVFSIYDYLSQDDYLHLLKYNYHNHLYHDILISKKKIGVEVNFIKIKFDINSPIKNNSNIKIDIDIFGHKLSNRDPNLKVEFPYDLDIKDLKIDEQGVSFVITNLSNQIKVGTTIIIFIHDIDKNIPGNLITGLSSSIPASSNSKSI